MSLSGNVTKTHYACHRHILHVNRKRTACMWLLSAVKLELESSTQLYSCTIQVKLIKLHFYTKEVGRAGIVEKKKTAQ